MRLHPHALRAEPRKKKYLIESKLCFELARYRCDTFAQYWEKMRGDATGVMERRMMDQLTTNYSFFCREEQHFSFMNSHIVSALPGNRVKPLRIWSAGCATGQECYTLAMHLSDCRAAGTLRIPFSILGTDLSEAAVAAAQKGSYGSADYARLPHSWQVRYCGDFDDGQFKVNESLKDSVSFQRQNLMDLPFIPAVYDLIFCRNVLIYFKDRERTKLIGRLTDALTPGGYLMIGHTETLLSIPNSLQYIEPSIYRKPEVRP